MQRTMTTLLLAGALAIPLLAGCDRKADPVSEARQADQKAGMTVPGINETRAIAEEAFIYGLPIVMNYAVMQEFCVDKNSGQYKAPFNTISNEARVFTYKDTAVVTPNSDTPYSMLWLDLRAEPMVISVPAVERRALLLGAADRRQHLQLRLHRQPGHGQRSGRLSGRRPGLARRDAGRDQEGLPLDDAVRAHHFPHPALQPRRHAERGESPGRATRRSRCPLS
jgi:hypothetical protein